MSKRLEVEVEGKRYWYDQEQEKALTKWRAEQEKMVAPMIGYMKEWIEKNKHVDYYDAKLLAELANYPEDVKEHFGVTTARHGKVENNLSKLREDYMLSNSKKDADKIMKNHQTKHPMTPGQAFKVEFKDPYYPYPKPGELYECGRVDTQQEWKLKKATEEFDNRYKTKLKPLGRMVVYGTGGEISDDLEKLQNMWHNSRVIFHNTNPSITNYSTWLDFTGSYHNVKDEDILLITSK